MAFAVSMIHDMAEKRKKPFVTSLIRFVSGDFYHQKAFDCKRYKQEHCRIGLWTQNKQQNAECMEDERHAVSIVLEPGWQVILK